MNQQAFLSEMGITTWSLVHADKMSGIRTESVDIPERYRLLLVSPKKPTAEETNYLEKVLASMKLTLSDTCQIFPHQIQQISQHDLNWVWYSGCEQVTGVSSISTTQQLQSPQLSELQSSPQHRKSLWQQICSYDKT